MKTCSKCKIEKSRSEFYKNQAQRDGLNGWCKECRKKHQQTEVGKATQRRANQKYYQTDVGKGARRRNSRKDKAKYPEKIKARDAVNNALRDGRLHKKPCPCGETKVQSHHESYEKENWLVVDWLCTKCHRELHRRKNETRANQ